MEEQTKLFLLNNQNLFSNNYLEHRLPNTDLWKEQKEKVSDVFDVIKKAYEDTKTLKLGPGEEAGLEDKFIRPVLKSLGFEWDVQPTTKRGLKKKRPDYALFMDKASLTDARKEKDNLVRFFKHPVTILEAKYWGRRLNDADPKDILDKRDPTAQTVKYLDDVYHASESRTQWAILTNGKHWRLFYYKAASRSGNFFEIDLEEIISREDKERFLYFYLFFSRDAFIPDSVTGKTWLEQHLKETEEYASRVSDKLKNLIFDQIFEGLASGFIEYRSRELGITKETKESLNEMAVELTKLSLWLDSFTLGAPLSFLDHHLKCGNSLIGIFDISDVIIPGSEMYGQVQRALSFMLKVSELTDATVSEAKASYDLFKKGREAIEPLIRRFDASTAKHFIDTGWTFECAGRKATFH
jgi:hypothetical protein